MIIKATPCRLDLNFNRLCNISLNYSQTLTLFHHHDRHWRLYLLPWMDEVIDGLNRLPMTKVLALDGLPAIVWKTLASEFGPLTYHSIVDIYIYIEF